MPAAEDTLTRCPPRRAVIIGGTKVSMTWMGPIRLMSTSDFQWWWVSLSTVPQADTPAMFITTSIAGCAAWMSAPNSATAS